MLLSDALNRDGTPTNAEPLPDDLINTRPLGTAPPGLLETRRITIIAATAGQSIVVLNIHSSSCFRAHLLVPPV
jgi:hypothetical protein